MSPIEIAEWENLSRLRAGDLSEAEARAVREAIARRPELRDALAKLDEIDDAFAHLPLDLDPPAMEAIVSGVMARDRVSLRRPRWWVVGAAAAAAAAAAAVAISLIPPPAPDAGWLLVGRDGLLEAPASRQLPIGATIRSAADAGAVVANGTGTILVGQNTGVRVGRAIGLETGTIAAQGERVAILVAGSEVLVHGTGLVSMEPLDALVRATEGTTSKGDTMKLWRRLGPPIAAAIGASAATVWILEGSATVTTQDGSALRLAAGEATSLPQGAPPVRVPAEPAVARRDPEPAPVVAAASDFADPASMTREALVAEVGRLRHLREDLLREKARLAARVASMDSGEIVRGTYHRLSPDALAEAAENGRVRIRLPHVFSGSEELWGERAAEEVSLEPAEESALRAAYAGSSERIVEGLRSLYVEMGGDVASAFEMNADSLFTEIQAKSLKGDREAAVRIAGQERAGLTPVGTSGSAIVRALRLLWQEDDRMIQEVDRILGAARAERFLDHPAWHHSDMTLSVGRRSAP